MAAALSTVRGAFAGLSPREKRLLIALAAVFMLLGFLGFWMWSKRRLDAIDSERADMVEALRFIQRSRPRIAARNQRREAMLARYRTRAPALTSYVEEQAHAANVQVAEAQDRPATPAGPRFTQRSVSIRLRQVSLEALADFFERIDSAAFPVAISSVRIRRRFGEANKYDIDDLVITTWDRVPEGNRTGAAGGAQGGAGAGTAADRRREEAR
ncbi:MAG: type II secretion system protein M [Deltaproteobacteria bacterium]|nr:type II secretion system protein M [Deltaproteobacteria bacterium]MBP6834327.1 type II secretion system protein M [Deltaproteobacteria bacterium]